MADSKQEMRINEAQAREIVEEEIEKLWTVWQESPLSWEQVNSMSRANVDKLAEGYEPSEVPVAGTFSEKRRNRDSDGVPAHIPDGDDIDIEVDDDDALSREEVEELARSAAKPVVKKALEAESESEGGTQRANYAGTPTGSSFDPPTGEGKGLDVDVPVAGTFDQLFDESGNGDGPEQ